MLSSKTEMAEWILDFFRNNKCRANEIVMFPNVMFAVSKLNPKEKDLFTVTANELIGHGYMSFEQNPVQCLRLSEKGENYIYDPEAVLDCCTENRKPTEKIFREIIYLGQAVTTLQAYQDILRRGELAETYSMLENPFVFNEPMRQLRVETLKEYFDILYGFFFSLCQLLIRVDDANLREVLFGYLSMVDGVLASENNIRRAPMIPQLTEIYNKAIASAKPGEEIQKLQQVRLSLFL